jgi:hypothetical protein
VKEVIAIYHEIKNKRNNNSYRVLQENDPDITNTVNDE